MILPLWNGVSELEILAQLAGRPKPQGPELVRETATRTFGAIEEKWNALLRVGFAPGSEWPEAPLAFNSAQALKVASEAKPVAGSLELVFLRSNSVDDGRYANNSWLQETPDFETKVTWDNVALVSPATAKKLGIKANNFGPLYKVAQELGNEIDFDIVADMIEIKSGGASVIAAAFVAPGHADDSISLALGYGRAGVSALFDGVGFNAYPLRSTDARRFLTGVEVSVTNRTYPLAQTQEHRSMEGRDLFREGTIERYEDDPKFAQTMGMDGHIPPNISLYSHPPLTSPEQWGMTVDLNTCFGCNACVVACQAENNVPVVGKEQVRKEPRHGLDSHGSLFRRRARRSRNARAGRHVPALRECAVRNGLPGQCDRAQRGRPQSHGLQSLHRNQVLLQQLPLEGASLQLLRLQPASNRPASTPGRSRKRAWPTASRCRKTRTSPCACAA